MTIKLLLLCLLVSQTLFAQRKASVAFTIKEKDLIPEGITYDEQNQCFFIGSIFKRKIIKVSRKGDVTDFVKTDNSGLLEVLGMKVNSQTRTLWVCNNSAAHDTVNKISNVHLYDLNTGNLLKKYQLEGSQKHLFNDLFITASGDAYITDSDGGAVFRIRKDSDNIEEFIKPGSLVYPNGITGTYDGKRLIVSTSGRLGLVTIDLDTKEIKSLASQRYLIIGLDGLYRYKRSLVAVQNLTFPESIHQYSLNENETDITNLKLVAHSHSKFNLPTTGVVVGDQFYFIANSQLSQLVGNNGKLRNPDALTDTYIMKLKLESNK